MPAKAGIQATLKETPCMLLDWMPAYAGMAVVIAEINSVDLKDMLQKYCALIEENTQYSLAAAREEDGNIHVENICSGTLLNLAEKYRDYPLILALEESYLTSQTWFFQSHLSSFYIYHHLSKKYPHCYLDVELLKKEAHEQCVVSYAIHQEDAAALQAPYWEAGFTVCALEPMNITHKKNLFHGWQEEARQKYFFNQTEFLLKLLDQEHFYVDEFTSLARS